MQPPPIFHADSETGCHSAHQLNGAHQAKVCHRALNEEVLQSAAEAVQDEVLRAGLPSQPSRTSSAGLLKRVEGSAVRYVLREPMKASVLAMAAGGLLALLLESRIKRFVRSS
jgi:hypothetical protein